MQTISVIVHCNSLIVFKRLAFTQTTSSNKHSTLNTQHSLEREQSWAMPAELTRPKEGRET